MYRTALPGPCQGLQASTSRPAVQLRPRCQRTCRQSQQQQPTAAALGIHGSHVLHRHHQHVVRTNAAAAGAVPYGDDGEYYQPASSSAAAAAAAGNSSFSQAVFNVLNVIMGVGLLSLPFALKQSGWAGLGILWTLGIVCNYTAKALVECHNVVTQRPENRGKKVGYEEVAEAAFGRLGRLVVSSAIYIELFGTCCLLFILEGDNLFNLLGATSLAANPQAYMLLAALAIIPTMWLPDLRALSFLGVCGITATASVLLTILYTLVTGSFTPGALTELAKPATAPLVFGIMAFVYSGHGVFPSIQASMREPQRFPQVLNVAYAIVAAFCTFVGAAGYYMYGTGALDVISFNLPAGLLATACACLILVNPIAKFAVTLEPVSNAITASLAAPASAATPAPPAHLRLATRTLAALAVLAAARYLPFLAPLMSLIGSFLTIGVSIIFPALLHLRLHPAASPACVATNLVVLAIGVVCASAGTAASLRSLAAKAAAASAGC